MSKKINRNLPPALLENAKIQFLNFSGAEGKFNAAGVRGFSVFLEDDVAEAMIADGWNVKFLTPRDPADSPQAHLPVAVNYKFRPPKIFTITSRGKTSIPEDLVGILDYAEIEKADLILNPSFYDVNGNQGIKAYLKEAYITLVESVLDQKYIDVPDSGRTNVVMGEIEDLGERLQIES